MKRFFFFTIIIQHLVFFCHGQKYDYNWVFDDSVGVNFNNLSSPTVFYPIVHGFFDENYASISDSAGNLMFYINNNSSTIGLSCVYNKFYQLMENGDSIPSHRSITQGTLILPFVNDTNKYYLLYLNIFNYNNIPNGLYYAVIDMSLNGDSGKVISKNNLLISGTLTEKLTAIRHGNGKDWWILTHNSNNNEFFKLHLSAIGFSSATSQFIGSNNINSSGSSTQGQLIFSRNGLYLCNAGKPPSGILEIFDFDRCSGMITNWRNLNNSGELFYGCSFSPNEKILYASSLSNFYQFNLDSVNVISTKLLLHTMVQSYIFGQHLLAPDNKIYIAQEYNGLPNTVYSMYNMNLTVINNPDSAGINCNFSPYSFSLNGRRCMLGLPNMVNYRLGTVNDSCNTTQINNEIESSDKIAIYPNPFNDELHISVNEKILYEFILWDITSNIIFHRNFSRDILLNTEQLAKGIYIYEVRGKDGSCKKGKVVKY